MESFQTPFIGCLRTGALQEQDEPAPLELLGALQRNPDAETEQDPITTTPTLCPRPKHQSPNPIDLSLDFVYRHIIGRLRCSSLSLTRCNSLDFKCDKWHIVLFRILLLTPKLGAITRMWENIKRRSLILPIHTKWSSPVGWRSVRCSLLCFGRTLFEGETMGKFGDPWFWP